MSKAEGFAAVPNWMIREKRVPRNAVLVYASLASRSGLGGIHPSQATLAEETGVSERTVRKMLTELETLGVVRRVRRTARQRGQSNRLPDGYTLHPNGHENLAADIAGSSELPEVELEATGSETASYRQQGASHSSIEVEPVEVEPAEVEAAQKRGRRIPDDFTVTPEMVDWARREVPLVDGARSTASFIDYWTAASGRNATKRDWVAAWRNWLRKDQQDAERRGGPRQSVVEHGRTVDQMLADREAGQQLAVTS